MVNIYSKIFQANQLKVGYDKNLNLDLKKFFIFLKKNISLIIIANPNSPTGTIIDKKNLIKILSAARRKKVAVLIDEAYFDFQNLLVVTSNQKVQKSNNCKNFFKVIRSCWFKSRLSCY